VTFAMDQFVKTGASEIQSFVCLFVFLINKKKIVPGV
jgi:hypothetical protein